MTATRAGENLKQFLEEIELGFYLMADSYQGYNKVKDAKRCCRFANVHRYFLIVIPKGHEKGYINLVLQGVLYCDKLFAYERTYKEKELSHKQIQKCHIKDQKPILEGILA